MTEDELKKLVSDLRSEVDTIKQSLAPKPTAEDSTVPEGVDKGGNVVLYALRLGDILSGLPDKTRADIMRLAEDKGVDYAYTAAQIAKSVSDSAPRPIAPLPRGVGATPPSGGEGWPTTIAEYRRLREKDREGAQALLRAGLNLTTLREK